MRTVIWMTAAAMLVAVGACGGSNKKADEPVETGGASEPEPAPKQDVLIPEEKFIEIKHFFERKARVVSKCVPDAIDAGEVGKNEKGHMTIQLVINKNGSPSNVEVSQTSFKSKTLESCVLGYINRWTFTTLPKKLPYSHTFVFESL